MANITPINPTQSISLAPAILNANFQSINTELGQIAGILSTAQSSLNLDGRPSIGANSLSAKTIYLSATSGNFLVCEGAEDILAFISSDGVLSAQSAVFNITLDSIFGGGTFKRSVIAENGVVAKKDLSLIETAVILYKNRILEVVPSNIGNSASSPVDLSSDQEVLIDASNGGSQFASLGSDVLLKIDATTLKVGQILTLRMLKKNSVNDIKLWNGTNVTPLFAKIDFTAGLVDIAHSVYPTFDTSAGLSWLKVQYLEVATGEFRLVILEHSNITNA